MADPFHLAARAYFLYGVIYLLGGIYLLANGVGVRGSRVAYPVSASCLTPSERCGPALDNLDPFIDHRSRLTSDRTLP